MLFCSLFAVDTSLRLILFQKRALLANRDIEFLFLAGHGTDTFLELGDPQYDKRGIPAEAYRIDINDKDLIPYFRLCEKLKRAFAFSCSNGKGKSSKKNMGNQLHEFTGHKVVITATASISAGGINVTSLEPFDAELSSYKEGKECKYIARHHIFSSDCEHYERVRWEIAGRALDVAHAARQTVARAATAYIRDKMAPLRALLQVPFGPLEFKPTRPQPVPQTFKNVF